MTEQPDPLERIIAILKEPAPVLPDLTERVMAEIAVVPAPEGVVVPRPVRWWQRRWTIRVSPLGGLAAAAGLTALLFASQRVGRRPDPAPEGVASGTEQAQPTQFVLVAPDAVEVTLVGDFNDWSVSATPLTGADGHGVWSVTVPLSPGRYRYAFVVDGTIWRADPQAPTADDEFGRRNSVVTIGGA